MDSYLRERGEPSNLNEAVEYLEEGLRQSIDRVEAMRPHQNAPLWQQISFAFEANRIEADTKFIEELRETGQFAAHVELDQRQ
ncbi:MAG TPA: hypothetical protein VG604_03740 [Candidatus Saccharimonadales bacterium]|nr:hypothetical protein [Candidatus Saccharimonadales bacterium]